MVGIISQMLISTTNSIDACRCFVESLAQVRIVNRSSLQLKHARNDLQAVLDAVIDFLQQHLMTIKRRFQLALILLLLDRHSKNVGSTLQKSDVALAKLAFGFAVHFQHTERRAVALQNNIHRAMNAVLAKQFRRSKSMLVLKVVRNDGLASAQRIAGGGGQIGPDTGRADNAVFPAHSGTDQEAVLRRYV